MTCLSAINDINSYQRPSGQRASKHKMDCLWFNLRSVAHNLNSSAKNFNKGLQ